MKRILEINHLTSYIYDRPTTLGPQCIRLKPSKSNLYSIMDYKLEVYPNPSSTEWFNDIYGNNIASVIFDNPTTKFNIEVCTKIQFDRTETDYLSLSSDYKNYPFFYTYDDRKKVHPYLGAPEPTKLFEEYCDQLRRVNIDTLDLADNINKDINKNIKYTKRFEPGIYSPESTLELKTGCCRDVAWLLVNIFRKLGIAARFVSGYSIRSGLNENENNELDLHAWCEIYLSNLGWVGLDATSGQFCGCYHIPLASAAFPFSTAPVEGLISKCSSTFNVEMRCKEVCI